MALNPYFSAFRGDHQQRGFDNFYLPHHYPRQGSDVALDGEEDRNQGMMPPEVQSSTSCSEVSNGKVPSIQMTDVSMHANGARNIFNISGEREALGASSSAKTPTETETITYDIVCDERSNAIHQPDHRRARSPRASHGATST